MKKTVIVIDYQATLQKFFKEIIKFLDNRVARIDSELAYRKVCKAREDIKEIAKNPKKYASYAQRIKDDVDPQPEAFMTNPQENSVYLILSQVLNNMGNLDSQFDWYRNGAEKLILQSVRAMEYKNSKNLFKDIKFMFMSDKKFGVTKQIER